MMAKRASLEERERTANPIKLACFKRNSGGYRLNGRMECIMGRSLKRTKTISSNTLSTRKEKCMGSFKHFTKMEEK